MCAVACLIDNSGKIDLIASIEAMTKTVAHRGPDAFDHKVFGKVALGHRRLAIVDTSADGIQPMQYKQLSITFNGEIYNYVELKKKLTDLGYEFQTQTDTEVLLVAYSHWGESCLDHLNGMWAFAIHDLANRKVFVARDHFGIKPLYFWQSSSGDLALASEIKQFSVLPGWQARLNQHRVADFLAHGITDHTDETLFADVKQLPGGCCFTVDLTKLSEPPPVRRWYRMPHDRFDGSYAAATDALREMFYDSVRLRLRADVGVGSCLSGGLDSSSIVCVASQILRKAGAADKQELFSACWADHPVDESRYMKSVVTRLDGQWNPVYPAPEELFKTLDRIIWHQDEPFASTSIFAQWKVFEAAHGRVKVMLDGQGADEELLGYPSYYSVHLAGLLRQNKWGRFFGEMRAFRREVNLGYRSQLASTANDFLPRSWSRSLKRLTANGNPVEQILAKRPPANPVFENGARRSLANVSRSQLSHTNLPMLLHWEDRNSMAHGIEARVPFLDHRLTELILSFPDEFKLAGGVSKKIFREAVAGEVPQDIIDRRDKIGFATPERDWFRGDWKKQIHEGCASAIQANPMLFKKNALAFLKSDLFQSPRFHGAAWRLYCFGRWQQVFQVS